MVEDVSPKSPTRWLGIALLLIGVLLAYLVVASWPRTTTVKAVSSAPAAAGKQVVQVEKKWVERSYFFGAPVDLDADVRLLILVLLAGALGSYVHAAQSFASYVGNESFKTTWTWWYVLRIPIGAALALFVYFVVRGGLAGTATGPGAADDLNLFGIMAFSGLAGLFSKQAADKLAEVFDTVFATRENRKDKLSENPRPEVVSVTPASVTAGAAVEITVAGQGFVKDSVVKASSKKLPTTFASPKSLTAKLATAEFAGRAEIEITVINPEPGGGESEPKVLTVKTASGEGMATVTSISRDAANPAEPVQAPQ